MKTPTKNQVRKFWLRVCKGEGTFSDGDRKLRFCHHKRVYSIPELGPVVRGAALVFSGGIEELFKKRAAMTVVLPSGTTVIVTKDKIGTGDPADEVELLFHEFTHYRRFNGSLSKVAAYLNPLDGTKRAIEEAHGNAGEADGRREMGKKTLKAKNIFTKSWGSLYMVDAANLKIAKKAYNTLIAKHDKGRYATSAGAHCAKVLRDVCG